MANSGYIKIFREHFKNLTVIDITHEEINDFNNFHLARGLSPTTLIHYSDVLRPALRQAFIDKIIPDNPYDRVKSLNREKPILNYYNVEELEILFDCIKNHKLNLMYKVLSYYGFRRSEVLGLRWSAIDFEHGSITVNHKVIRVKKQFYATNKLKSKKSHRTLPLVANLTQDLWNHKQEIEKNKKNFGNAYDYKWEEYIFVNEMGRLYNPDYISKSFSKVLEKNELKHIRLHDLRHSCASLLSKNGVSLKEIQEWLGHADFLTTAVA